MEGTVQTRWESCRVGWAVITHLLLALQNICTLELEKLRGTVTLHGSCAHLVSLVARVLRLLDLFRYDRQHTMIRTAAAEATRSTGATLVLLLLLLLSSPTTTNSFVASHCRAYGRKIVREAAEHKLPSTSRPAGRAETRMAMRFPLFSFGQKKASSCTRDAGVRGLPTHVGYTVGPVEAASCCLCARFGLEHKFLQDDFLQ